MGSWEACQMPGIGNVEAFPLVAAPSELQPGDARPGGGNAGLEGGALCSWGWKIPLSKRHCLTVGSCSLLPNFSRATRISRRENPPQLPWSFLQRK